MIQRFKEGYRGMMDTGHVRFAFKTILVILVILVIVTLILGLLEA